MYNSYSDLKKAQHIFRRETKDLSEYCGEQDLPTEGNRAELMIRLVEHNRANCGSLNQSRKELEKPSDRDQSMRFTTEDGEFEDDAYHAFRT